MGGVTDGGVVGPYPEVAPGPFGVADEVAAVSTSAGCTDSDVVSRYQMPIAQKIPTINPMINFRMFMQTVYHDCRAVIHITNTVLQYAQCAPLKNRERC